MKNCGNCIHARLIPEDITKRVCRGAPPQIVAIPMAGSIQLRHIWPTVESKDEGCGMHKEKLQVFDVTTGKLVVDNIDPTGLKQ